MKLVKTPDARLEVLHILENRMLERQPGIEDYHCGMQRMSAYFKQHCELSKAEADRWFQPLLKIEQHVLKKLKLPEATMLQYFDSPGYNSFSPAGLIAAVNGAALQPDAARAMVLTLVDPLNEDNMIPAIAPLSMTDFIDALQKTDLPDGYRWKLVELCSDWPSHQAVVEDILTRGAALFEEVVQLAQPLIDDWYESMRQQLDRDATCLQVGQASILLHSGRDYTVYPYLMRCNATSTTVFEPPLDQILSMSPSIHSGVLCDAIAARMEQLQQGDNTLLRGLRALGDKQRLLIFRALAEAPRYSGELVKLTGLSPATISHHMGELLRAGLVDMEDAGSRVVYHIDQNGLTDLADAVRALI